MTKSQRSLNSQLPDFVVDDHPQFVIFKNIFSIYGICRVAGYFSIESTDGITLENETGRFK